MPPATTRGAPKRPIQSATKATIKALNHHAKYIRGRLGPYLHQMKYMPEVRFRDDTSFDNYSRIDALLRSPEVVRDLNVHDDNEE